MRDLCESAKRGHCCPDDLCHGADVTLCGFDKELYEEILRDMDDDTEDAEPPQPVSQPTAAVQPQATAEEVSQERRTMNQEPTP